MSEQCALRTEKLHRPRGGAGQVLDAAREGDESRRDDGAGELRHVRSELSNGTLHIGLDRLPLSRDVLCESGERLQFLFVAVREFRANALSRCDWHPLTPSVECDQGHVRPGVHHGCEFREMETVPFAQTFDHRVLLFLNLIERADRLTKMVLGSDRLAQPAFREADHRVVEEVTAIAERFRIEEGRALPSKVSARAFEARFHDEDVVGERHELPLFWKDLPVLREGEALREGTRLFWKESTLHHLALVQEEGPEPGCEEQHAGAKGMIP